MHVRENKIERYRLGQCVLCLGMSAECQAEGHHNYHRLIISHFARDSFIN